MSLSSEITRLQNAKSALKTSIEAKGVTVSDSTLISGYAALVDQISTGGGGGGGNEDLINLIERDVTTFNIPSGTTKIGDYAFSSCRGLTSVSIPNSVVAIGEYAFSNTGLTSVAIPDSVESIGGYAFSSCRGLTSVIVPNYIPSVENNVFEYCYSLPVENYIKYAGTWAIEYESNQTSYTLREDTTYLVGTFNYCEKITSVGELGSGASVEIPNSVVAIGANAFSSCRRLTSVSIPNSVVAIGEYAFSDCEGLTGVTIPNSVTSIGDSAFRECRELTSVTIPDSVTSIGSNAFYRCTSLTSVTIQATTPPTLGGTSVFNNTNNCPIYVPAESVDAYKTATNWSRLAGRIEPIPTV